MIIHDSLFPDFKKHCAERKGLKLRDSFDLDDFKIAVGRILENPTGEFKTCLFDALLEEVAKER